MSSCGSPVKVLYIPPSSPPGLFGALLQMGDFNLQRGVNVPDPHSLNLQACFVSGLQYYLFSDFRNDYNLVEAKW